jgi:hypothetical protein
MAGVGATGVLIGAAVLAFVTLAALFSFNGLPRGLGPSEADAVFVAPDGAGPGAPEAAAAALATAPGAVVAAPAGGGAAGGGAAAAAGSGAGGGTGTGGPGAPPATAPPGSDVPAGVPPESSPGAAAAPPETTSSGPVSDTVAGLEGTAEGTTGLDLPLSETTKPLTDQLDQTVQGVGGALGGNN